MIIIDAGLPMPELQYSIVVDGVERYRLDLAYPKHRICIEYDGVEFHTTPQHREADEARRAWLRDAGWTAIVLTRDDLRQGATTQWLDDVRSQLLERTPWPRG
jgi:very-short-patch-repair endonuclease